MWAGGGGDDLAKSPHMARIGNSVYHDICPGDPTCSQFGFYQGGIPTPMMEKCLLYKMVRYGEPGVPSLDKKRFTHAYSSKYGKVRIFKVMNVSRKSKEWVADPANRVCDAPGSWYCTGQYPPALASLIAKRKPFRQLEDFNVAKDEASQKYQDEYHRRMEGRGGRNDDFDDYDASEGMSNMGLASVGCFGAEAALGSDKVYTGGKNGAQISVALQWAAQKRKKFVAVARAGVDGHAFAFSQPPDMDMALDVDDGCDAPCLDIDSFSCGCADAVCRENGARPTRGEQNARRWVVYEVPAEFMEAAATRRGGSGGGGGKRKGSKKSKR